MKINQIEVGSMQNFTYLLVDDTSDHSIIIDPSWNLENLKELITQQNLKVKYIVNTHHHFDHVLGNEIMSKFTKAEIIQHKNSPLRHDISVDSCDKIKFGACELTVIHTPGHSQDSICLINDQCIFSGDTVFVGAFGRTDLPGGDAGQLYDTVSKILSKLKNELVLYPGHNYGPTTKSTIQNEKKTNFIFLCKNKQDFLKYY
ncbi:MAG: MBL fold metallo-hydrolase [Thaumarchaeota archaeon]|nr:MBL fold metallo-hydrolase [Nitrososphaerota archaeon]MCY3976151.1 MBL fold metallo-hydrolase [Nitrososphaerota archaeon]